ncbi:hypothetical protein ACJMK2_039934 [Sinanodonta woodiana]|uniref:Uncharacterized protein n=1 Tax=Sinanodonta woodiana TaxID=1069815 RepID=A0ABD3WDM1_SINWO
MSKGATPHNYNLRSKIDSELLRPSDFTPPSFVSTPKSTAPPQPNQLCFTPTTSLLLETAALYTSPLHPPLSSFQTTLTNATSIITTPVILPQPCIDSMTIAHSASSLPSPNQSASDFTPIEHSLQPQFSLGPFKEVQVLPKPNEQNVVLEQKTLP